MEMFLQPDIWVALLTLVFLEIVLGIDNILFISIASSRLPENQQRKATNIGLFLAMILRVILLFGIAYIVAMETVLLKIDLSWLKAGITGQSLIMLAGGLFCYIRVPKKYIIKLKGKKKPNLLNQKTHIV